MESKYCTKCGKELEIDTGRTIGFNEVTGERILEAVKKCKFKRHWWDGHTKMNGRYNMARKSFGVKINGNWEVR